MEEGARRLVRGDEGAQGRERRPKGEVGGEEGGMRVRTGGGEGARPGKTQGRGSQGLGPPSRGHGRPWRQRLRRSSGGGGPGASLPPSRGARTVPAGGAAAAHLFPTWTWRFPAAWLRCASWLRRFTSCDLLWRRIARPRSTPASRGSAPDL